jgi:hypothetical protein
MAESPVLGFQTRFLITNANGIRFDLSEAVEVQLSYKAGKIVVFEKGGNLIAGKFFWILHHKGRPVLRPCCYIRIAGIDHFISPNDEKERRNNKAQR